MEKRIYGAHEQRVGRISKSVGKRLRREVLWKVVDGGYIFESMKYT